MKRTGILSAAACASLLLASSAFGYIRLVFTDAGGSVAYYRLDAAGIQFYVNDQIKAGQVSNASGSAVTVVSVNSDPVSAIEAALAQWNSVSPGTVNFLPLRTTSAVHNPVDFQAVITFASADDLSVMGYSPGKSTGLIAATISAVAQQAGVLPGGAFANRGDILDSDILLNSSLPFSTDGSTPYDIQTVVTHELGHALGANHTGLEGATMFQYSTVNSTAILSERLLSSDDRSFLMAAYPSSGSLGTVGGRVLNADGSPVKAALITLTDTAGGNSVGAITDANGTYSVQAPAASYIVYAEPMTSNSVVQPGNIQLLDPSQVTSNFQPTMLGGPSSPTSVNVAAGGTGTAPNLTVTAGPGSLSLPFVGFGAAGATGDIHSVVGPNAPKVLASGQSVDIAFVGGGIDGTENIMVLGQGISVRPGSFHIDKGISFSNGPLVRGTLDIAARNNSALASVFVTKPTGAVSLSGYLVLVPPQPAFVTAGVDSAASAGIAQALGAVSPGGISAIYDVPGMPNLGPLNPISNGGYDAYGKLPGNLAGVTVTFDGIPAPLFFVYGGQINLQVPFEIAGQTSTQVVVGNQGSYSAPVTVPVVAAQPAFFMIDAMRPFAANQDSSTNSAANPAARGTVLSVYGTGLGQVSYSVPTGMGAPGPAPGYTGNYTCTLGSESFAVPFAGWTPTSVGLAQWSFVVPADAATGAVSVKCAGGSSGASTQSATVYIK